MSKLDYATERERERLEQAIAVVDAQLKLPESEKDLLLDQRIEYVAALTALRERAGVA